MLDLLPASNLEALNFNKETIRQLLLICKPIFDNFQITYFRYMRVYESGKYFSWGNQLNYLGYYLQEIENLGCIFKPMYINAPKDSYHFFLWPDQISNSTKNRDAGLEALYAYNIWNGMSIHKKNDNYVESWNFAGDKNSIFLKDFFTNNQESIVEFIKFFQYQAKELLEHRRHTKLASFKDPLSFSNIQTKEMCDLIGKFRFSLKKRNQSVSNIIITTREKECLESLTKGRSMKEIAKELGISPRTVEFHINNIKLKTGCHYKLDLIKFYEQNANSQHN